MAGCRGQDLPLVSTFTYPFGSLEGKTNLPVKIMMTMKNQSASRDSCVTWPLVDLFCVTLCNLAFSGSVLEELLLKGP